MPTSTLRKVGGSVMVAVPPTYLEQTGLGPRGTLVWTIEGDKLVLQPSKSRPRYSLNELLAQCDPAAEPPTPDRSWTDGPPAGGELM